MNVMQISDGHISLEKTELFDRYQDLSSNLLKAMY